MDINSVIIIWGTYSQSSAGSATWNFPISFPHRYVITRQRNQYTTATEAISMRANDIETTTLSSAKFYCFKNLQEMFIGVGY